MELFAADLANVRQTNFVCAPSDDCIGRVCVHASLCLSFGSEKLACAAEKSLKTIIVIIQHSFQGSDGSWLTGK